MLQRERKLVLLSSTQFWQWWACSSRTAVWFLCFVQRAAFAWAQPFFLLFQCRLASHFLQIATANCHRHSPNNSCRRPCLSIYSCRVLLSDYCWWLISARIACFWQHSVPDIAGLVPSAPILCQYELLQCLAILHMASDWDASSYCTRNAFGNLDQAYSFNIVQQSLDNLACL